MKSNTWTGKNTFSAGYFRDNKWDTVKFFMIFCVVFGHILYYFTYNHPAAKGIYFFIYTFHIPVFVFLSGMFSKNTIIKKKWDKSLFYLLLYCILKIGIAAIKSLKTGELQVHLLWDSTPAWYLLAMAVYFVVTIVLLQKWKINQLLIIALFLGCIAGCDNHFGDHYASMRIATFYPFFLMGYKMDAKRLRSVLTDKKIQIPAFLIIVLAFMISLKYNGTLYSFIQLLKGRTTYEAVGLSGLMGPFVRVIYYIGAFLLIFCILSIIPALKGFPSALGQNTLIIYILHPFIITLFFEVLPGSKYINAVWPTLTIPALFFMTLILVILLGCLKYPFKSVFTKR